MMMSDVGLTSDVCLSVAYIGPKSRTERPIGTEVAHATRDSDTSFKFRRSRSPGRFAHRRVGASVGCSGRSGNVLSVGNCSAAQGASAPTGEERGAYRGGRQPTVCLIHFISKKVRS